MTRDEFKTWADDFRLRFPDTGLWISKLSREARDVWFSDVFAALDLRDCLAVNCKLMADPSELEGYNRERIPGIYIKRCAQMRHDRAKREDHTKQRMQRGAGFFGGDGVVDADSGMRVCLVEARKFRDEVLRKDFIDQWFDKAEPVRTALEFVGGDESQLKTAEELNRYQNNFASSR